MAAPKTITLTVNSQPLDLEAKYLSPAALDYWQAWLGHRARLAHNPFAEFSAKVAVLPAELQAVALREFTSGLNFDIVPKVVVIEVSQSLEAVQLLCVLVTGRDVVTKDNYREAALLLYPFIKRQEIVTGSLEEANRLRAEVGKPPLGKSGPPVQEKPTAEAVGPPQGG